MASPMTAGHLPACPRSPPISPAPNGTVRGFLDSGRHPVWKVPMASDTRLLRCAIYTRKSTEHGLEQEFNSLDAQREAGEAFIASQKHLGWEVMPDRYDDG